MALLSWLYRRTLNSVWFGILLMTLTAIYIALGSGLAPLREYFEMDEMAFFNAWPLKLLMMLLVLNLCVVTFTRIPFTVPRYGVWCVHAGIVTLIFGMAFYYKHKVEGMAIIPVGGTATHYYDRWERALYVKVGTQPVDQISLPGLPRFNAYSADLKNTGRLDRSTLRDRAATIASIDDKGKVSRVPLSKWMGLKDEIHFDIVGYHPYAELETSYVERPGGTPGLRVTATDLGTGESMSGHVLADFGPDSTLDLGTVVLNHRHVTPDVLAGVRDAVSQMHALRVTLGNGEPAVIPVDVGREVTAGDYRLVIESYDPAFPTMSREIVSMITMMVYPPEASGIKPFRRQVIQGRDKPTDWLQGTPDAGPIGLRQSEPLDNNIKVEYRFTDPFRLAPPGGLNQGGQARTTVFTADNGEGLVVSTGITRKADAVGLINGRGQFEVPPIKAPFADAVMGSPRRVEFTYSPSIRRVDKITDVPPAKRVRNLGESGVMQVVEVKVTAGDWSQVFAVPYSPWAWDIANQWRGPTILLPGARVPIQLQLGNNRLQLPGRVTLDRFELVNYMGGSADTAGIFRDFKSHVTLSYGDGIVRKDVAHMNNPIYFGGDPIFNTGDSFWTLFQSQWDPEGQRWTVLGVGNRPGIWAMTIGCVLMSVGLLYAFYVKPLVIRSMKRKALEKAAAEGRLKAPQPVVGKPPREVAVGV